MQETIYHVRTEMKQGLDEISKGKHLNLAFSHVVRLRFKPTLVQGWETQSLEVSASNQEATRAAGQNHFIIIQFRLKPW